MNAIQIVRQFNLFFGAHLFIVEMEQMMGHHWLAHFVEQKYCERLNHSAITFIWNSKVIKIVITEVNLDFSLNSFIKNELTLIYFGFFLFYFFLIQDSKSPMTVQQVVSFTIQKHLTLAIILNVIRLGCGGSFTNTPRGTITSPNYP